MKRYVYVLCLMASLWGLTSCNKTDTVTPVSPIVGRWELSRGLLSGFPAATNFNGAAIDLYYFESVGSTIDIYSDNTFNSTFKNVTVDDAAGTWTFDNNNLTLKYDSGDEEKYTYAKNKNIEELALTGPISYTLPVSATATAVGNVQLIYRK
ncbi:lipocalin family protein [Spirosoma sp. BT702]|uniref:Lipocalin family protein n=1 Tax=Spirosoma profusum TaxID=2771354 RepID=A0A927AMG3_9BACT|nr:lipocalin family protein [Spirosoma profusum]MBD2699734.1 lipocalin family protein [Spirosoma profusum]